MVSGFSGRSVSTPGSVLQLNRITTLMIGSHWPSWKHWNSGDTTSRAPNTRFGFGVSTRISDTSRHPKCSPEDKPGGQKFSQLTMLSSRTRTVGRTQPMVHADGPTTRSASNGLGNDYWQLSQWNHTTIRCQQSSWPRLPTFGCRRLGEAIRQACCRWHRYCGRVEPIDSGRGGSDLRREDIHSCDWPPMEKSDNSISSQPWVRIFWSS